MYDVKQLYDTFLTILTVQNAEIKRFNLEINMCRILTNSIPVSLHIHYSASYMIFKSCVEKAQI